MGLPRRVLLIGLDALDGRSLRRWMLAGRLPNLASFAGRSHGLTVRSDGELLHGSVWPTFALGAGPGHHGIYWWTQWLAEEARYVRNGHASLSYDPFWLHAGAEGKRSIIVDVPYVHAVRDGHTWTAIGWGLHDEVEPTSYPERFLPAIRRRYGDHPLRMDTMHSMASSAKRKMARDMAKGVSMRARLVSDFASRRDWEMLLVTFSECHKAAHYLAAPEDLGNGFTNEDAAVSLLEPFDRALPEIVERAGEDTDVAIFALHGIDAQVEFSAVASQFAALLDGRSVVESTPRPDMVRRLRDLMPDGLQQAIWYLLPPSIRQRRFANLATQGLVGSERIFHVAHDGAFALRLNLAGRERTGHVTTDEGAALLARAAELAAGLTTESGERATRALVRPPLMHPGPRAHRLPDALVPPNPAVFKVERLRTAGGETLTNPQPEARNGVHNGNGFCFYRPGAETALLRTEIDSRDFAPTILQRLGVAPPPSLEGSPFLR